MKPTPVSNGAFLLFPDGVHPISVDGEAHDQGELEVKGSVSQKKALATLKVTGCWEVCSDSETSVCHLPFRFTPPPWRKSLTTLKTG